MKYEQVIRVFDDLLLLLSNHRCVDDLKASVTFHRSRANRLHSLCLEAERWDVEKGEASFERCFSSKKGHAEFEQLLKEVKRRTTAQLTTGMPMFRQKARQSIALRNKHLLRR